MNKLLKKGDKIRIVSSQVDTYWYTKRIGEVFTVSHDREYREGCSCVSVDYYAGGIDWEDFELVTEDNKMFDMHTQPWFIRYDNREEFDLVQKWLKENFDFDTLDNYYESTIGCTNTDNDGGVCKNIMWLQQVHIDYPTTLRHEIKLNVKTVVDSVEYPIVETEQEKKIKELEGIIIDAKVRLEELKNTSR